jgi:hypothetical protein
MINDVKELDCSEAKCDVAKLKGRGRTNDKYLGIKSIRGPADSLFHWIKAEVDDKRRHQPLGTGGRSRVGIEAWERKRGKAEN